MFIPIAPWWHMRSFYCEAAVKPFRLTAQSLDIKLLHYDKMSAGGKTTVTGVAKCHHPWNRMCYNVTQWYGDVCYCNSQVLQVRNNSICCQVGFLLMSVQTSRPLQHNKAQPCKTATPTEMWPEAYTNWENQYGKLLELKQSNTGDINGIQINGKRTKRAGCVYTEQTVGWGEVRGRKVTAKGKGGGGRNKGFADEREKGWLGIWKLTCMDLTQYNWC